MNAETVAQRELNRATLARQLLLERSALSVPEALERLVGLQAQTANSWYTGLWSRLGPFEPTDVSRLIEERRIVRVALMRSTIHLVTAEDALTLRPTLQAAVERPMTGSGRRRLAEMGTEEIIAEGRRLLEERPMTNLELGRLLAARWPEHEPADLVMAVRVGVPLVQVPPRGLWGRSGAAAHTPLQQWLGSDAGSAPPASAEQLVRRYLHAFGPATPADAQTWSGLTRLAEVFERLRPELVTFRDPSGRECFDVPDAPRPGADVPAPVRLLYDFDNLLLSHADRSRFLTDERRRWMLSVTQRFSYGSLLVDGFVAGVWRLERARATAAVVIRLAEKLASQHQEQVAEEASSLLALWAPDTPGHDVRFELAESA